MNDERADLRGRSNLDTRGGLVGDAAVRPDRIGGDPPLAVLGDVEQLAVGAERHVEDIHDGLGRARGADVLEAPVLQYLERLDAVVLADVERADPDQKAARRVPGSVHTDALLAASPPSGPTQKPSTRPGVAAVA